MGQSKRKSDVLLAKHWQAEGKPCHKCGCKCGAVVQWRDREAAFPSVTKREGSHEKFYEGITLK